MDTFSKTFDDKLKVTQTIEEEGEQKEHEHVIDLAAVKQNLADLDATIAREQAEVSPNQELLDEWTKAKAQKEQWLAEAVKLNIQ